MSLAQLPTLNAVLNATSAILLCCGIGAIRAKWIRVHVGCLMGACVSSALFLASYLAYHAQVGSVHFTGTGWSRPAYFTLLVSHTVLAVVIIPLIARTLFFAARRRFDEHVAIARWTSPLWFYVSVTGLLVYWMLYQISGNR